MFEVPRTPPMRSDERMLSLENSELAIFAMAKVDERPPMPETGAHWSASEVTVKFSHCRCAVRDNFKRSDRRRVCPLIYLTSRCMTSAKFRHPDCVLL